MGITSAVSDKAQNIEFSPLYLRQREMENVISSHSSAFHRHAMRHLGNTAGAEDAVQDALLSAFRHLAQFRGEAQMSTWLMRIVINSARTQLRKRSRERHVSIDEHPEKGEAFLLLDLLADHGLSPEEACSRSDLHLHAHKLAQKLSPDLREAFRLRDLEGRTLRQMSDAIGASVSAVKTRVSRARAKLKRLARTI